MSQVTLIGERIAKPGTTFVFLEPRPACRECKLKSACLQLDRGRLYEVLKARDICHRGECRYHENGVRVVEVQLATVGVSLRSKLAIEGSALEFAKPTCSNHQCENYSRCHPNGLAEAARVRVLKIANVLSCPLGYDLTGAEVEYA